MRVILTGGGTGGHVYPALAIGAALRATEADPEILYVGSPTGPESALAAAAGFDFAPIPSAPLSIGPSAFVKLFFGTLKARRLLSHYRTDVVVGTGGYASAPVVLAQRLRRGKTLIHEQNAIPGRANLWMSRFASKVCVTFEDSERLFPVRAEVTGMPIREEFSHLPAKSEARERLGLREDAFTILVSGGSQGARKLNSLMLDAWQLLDDGRTQVLHQVGVKNLDSVSVPVDERGVPEADYRIEGYLDNPVAMAVADIAVCRAGASTTAELAAAGLPSILVPYPYAYADHQTYNARSFSEKGAAILMPESTLTPKALAEAITELRDNPDKRDNMSEAARSLARPDAARRVAELVVELAKGQLNR